MTTIKETNKMFTMEYDDTMVVNDAIIAGLMDIAQYFVTQKQNNNIKKTEFYHKIKSCIEIAFGPSNKMYQLINKYYECVPIQLNEAFVFYILYYFYINKELPSDNTIAETIIPNVLPQKYMDLWMGLEHITLTDIELDDIDLAPPQPSPRSQHIWEYKKSDNDNEQMEGLEHDTGDTSLTSRTGAQNNVSKLSSPKIEIAFIGIDYDPKMHVGKEENYIRACLNFDVTRSGFTKTNLEHILMTQPTIIHISTHGRHTNQFEIALEEPHLLIYLLDNHSNYSAYYAVLAVFFEMEIDHFVRLGSKENNNKIEIKCELLNEEKIYKMLQCIADRYGCCCRKKHNICVEISWGKSEHSTFVPPHAPVEFFTFSSIYSNDKVVKPLVKKIISDYNCCVTAVPPPSKIPKHQKFSWDELAVLLQRMLSKHCSETTDGNDAITAANTQIKIGTRQDLMRELLIEPNMSKTEFLNLNGKRQQEVVENLEKIKIEIVSLLKKKKEEISEDFSVYNQRNIHVICFKNECALEIATNKMDDIGRDSKYNNYKINFRSLAEAQNITKQIVGFIPKTEERIYAIDTKNQTDEISFIIKRCLNSRSDCNIKLVVLNACNSYMLGKIFSEYVENVICIHPFVKILDSTANTLTKYFYESLQKYMDANPCMLFSDCVFKAYSEAKEHIAEKCADDFACKSHSHLTHCRAEEGQINDFCDGKTLLISNVSTNDMRELYTYLKNGKLDANEDQKEEEFIKKGWHQKNVCFDELSHGYFKFETKTDRNEAQMLLSQKQNDGTKSGYDDFKSMEHQTNLRWTHRIVPNCCCSPFHPHAVEDKLILLQNGNIINREIKTKINV